MHGTLEQFDLGVDYLPLLSGTVQIRELALLRPQFDVVFDPEAEWEESESTGIPLRLAVADLIEGGRTVSLAGSPDPVFVVDSVTLSLRDVAFDPAAASPMLGVAGEGELSANRVTAGGYVFDTISGAARIGDGVFAADDLVATAAFGRLELPHARADLSSGEPRVELAATAADINLNMLLGADGDSMGNAAMEIALRGQGTAPGWLAGEGRLSFAGGGLPSVPLLTLMDDAVGGALAQVEYEPVDIVFRVSDAELTIDPFELLSEVIRVRAGGRVLADGALEMDMTGAIPRMAVTAISVAGPMLDALTDEDQWTTFPVRVRGTMEQPEVGLDMGAMQKAALENTKKGLGDKLRRGIGGLIRRIP